MRLNYSVLEIDSIFSLVVRHSYSPTTKCQNSKSGTSEQIHLVFGSLSFFTFCILNCKILNYGQNRLWNCRVFSVERYI